MAGWGRGVHSPWRLGQGAVGFLGLPVQGALSLREPLTPGPLTLGHWWCCLQLPLSETCHLLQSFRSVIVLWEWEGFCWEKGEKADCISLPPAKATLKRDGEHGPEFRS